MNKIFKCFLLASGVLFSACSEPIDSYVQVQADLEHTNSIFNENIIDSVSVISLQDSSVMIQSIDKIYEKDTLLYVLDKQRSILIIYNQKGKYIATISNRGHASNEYIGIDDFFIDPEDSSINIISGIDKKLFKYNREGSKLLDVKHMSKSYRNMSRIKNGYIGYVGNNIDNQKSPYNFWTMDNNFNIMSYALKINDNLANTYHRGISYISDYRGMQFLLTDKSLDVFCIEKIAEKPNLYTRLYVGDKKAPTLTTQDYSDSKKMFELSNKYVLGIYHFQETDRFLLFHYLYQGQSYLTAYDKLEKGSKTMSLTTYTKRYFFPFGKIISTSKDFIYTVVDAQDIYFSWNGSNGYVDFEKEYPVQVANIRALLKRVDPDGNPFIIKYRIRK